ncbi:MAG: NADH-quinone oxidoreductase subunit M, partial [Sphingobacteriales bacterium]
MDFLLSCLVFVPLPAALLVLLLPRTSGTAIKTTALAATFLQLVLAVVAFLKYQAVATPLADATNYQLVEKVSWISLQLGALGNLQINYFLGVDGLNISLVLLSGIVLFIGAISSFSIKQNIKGYFALYLLLATSVMGCFVALDFFLFYLFFEFMLLPMYFLIGMWGGPRREYAAIKFFLYTLLGSIFILLAMIGLYLSVLDPAATAVQLRLITDPNSLTPQLLQQVQELLAQGKIPAEQLVHSFSLVDMLDARNFVPGSLLDEGRAAI